MASQAAHLIIAYDQGKQTYQKLRTFDKKKWSERDYLETALRVICITSELYVAKTQGECATLKERIDPLNERLKERDEFMDDLCSKSHEEIYKFFESQPLDNWINISIREKLLKEFGEKSLNAIFAQTCSFIATLTLNIHDKEKIKDVIEYNFYLLFEFEKVVTGSDIWARRIQKMKEIKDMSLVNELKQIWYSKFGEHAPAVDLANLNYKPIPFKFINDEVLKEFKCPLTQEAIRYPVTARNPHGNDFIFEKRAIVSRIRRARRSGGAYKYNGIEIKITDLREHLHFRLLIEERLKMLKQENII